jgi:hypothetical protein
MYIYIYMYIVLLVPVWPGRQEARSGPFQEGKQWKGPPPMQHNSGIKRLRLMDNFIKDDGA